MDSQDIGFEKSSFPTRDGSHLPLRIWQAEGRPVAVLLCVHGFNDYSHAFDGLGRFLASRGVSVYAYDVRGCGEAPEAGFWPGGGRLVEDFLDAVVHVKRTHMDLPLSVLGESLGGAIVLIAEAQNIKLGKGPLPVERMILSAPAAWGRDTQPWYQHVFVNWMSHFAPQASLPLYTLGRRPTDNEEILLEIKDDPLIKEHCRLDRLSGALDLMDEAQASAAAVRTPCLLLYGQQDEIIPRESIDRFWDTVPYNPSSRFLLYPEGWHLLTRDVQAEVVMADIDDWIRQGDVPQLTGRNRVIVPKRRQGTSQETPERLNMAI